MMSDVRGRKSLRNALVGFVLACGGLLHSINALAQQTCPQPDFDITLLSSSYCELCAGGQVTLRIENNTPPQNNNFPFQYQNENRDFTDVEVTVDLGQLDQVYTPSQYTDNLGVIAPGASATISFDLAAIDSERERLALDNISRLITTSATYTYGNCSGEEYRRWQGGWGPWQTLPGSGLPTDESNSDSFELPIREPGPVVTKEVRNVDAGMPQETFSNNVPPNGDRVFGHEDDGIIWRVTIANGGNAPMYDVIFDDTMNPGGAANMDIVAVCPNEVLAEQVAQLGTSVAGCFPVSGDSLVGQSLSGLGFGNVIGVNDDVVMYIAGTLRNSCVNQINTANGVEWGCFLNGGTSGPRINNPGDISSGVENGLPDYSDNTASFGALPGINLQGILQNPNNSEGRLNYQVEFFGLNGPGEPVGMRGIVRVTVQNLTGGTVNNVVLTDTLPDEYILDPNFEPQFSISSFGGAYQNYPGRASRLDWVNRVAPVAGNQSYLSDSRLKNPIFHLTSDDNDDGSYTGIERANDDPDQIDLMRHGDQAVITFRIVQVNQDESLTYYDRMADLDVNDESLSPGSLDPLLIPELTNTLRVQWGDFCDSNGNGSSRSDQTREQEFTPNPENLNVDIPEPLYIIRDDGPTDVSVIISNSGGHTATDFLFYVTFGNGLVVSPPAQCVPADENPPLHPDFDTPVPLWNTPPSTVVPNPTPLPALASVFQCLNGDEIDGGDSQELEFQVTKRHGATADDITLRADVVGEVTLAVPGLDYSNVANWDSSGEALVYPDPAVLNDPIDGTTPAKQLANNYTLDAVRARALGFNLLKRYVPGSCKEIGNRTSPDGNGKDVPPQILIGEECEFDIYAGGWFGFETPGWDITVDNIFAADALPVHAGGLDSSTGRQNYISKQELQCPASGGLPNSPNSVCSGVINPSGFSPASQLTDGNLSWVFNGISVNVKDQWFLANMTTRLLNDLPDEVNGPNQHSGPSVDYGRASFQVHYESSNGFNYERTIANDGTGQDGDGSPSSACFKSSENWGDLTGDDCNADYPGYPQWPYWTAELQVTEPRLTIAKEVCNFSNASQNIGACQWGDSAQGSKFDDFVYRLTVRNEVDANGVPRAPAYDVVITDVLDDGGQMCVWAVNGAFDDDDGIPNIPGDTANAQAGMVGIDIGLENYTYDYSNPDSSTDCIEGGNPAHITFSYEHSDKLKRIDSGAEVVLQYRVTPHRTVLPNQPFDNTADIFRYDSLFGVSGAQTVQPVGNINHPGGPGPSQEEPRKGGARVYCLDENDESTHCASASASMTIYDVDVEPKRVVGLSTVGEFPNAPIEGALDAVVGEEIRYRLTGLVPAARLREFTFHDDLPNGLRCVEAEVRDLRTIPGTTWSGTGPLLPTISGCQDSGADGTFVRWEYNDPELIGFDISTYPSGLIPVEITFVARVENSNFTQHGADLINPRPGGRGYMSYLPEGSSVGDEREFPFPPVTVNVRGPRVELTKVFSVEESDADDIVTVTVTATNPDSVTSALAYNLEVLDDLRSTKYRYVENSVTGLNGTTTPLVRLLDSDPNAPIFYWDDPIPNGSPGTVWPSPYAFPVDGTIEFSFQVRIVGEGDAGADVAPHEELANTIEASWQSLPNSNLALNSSGSIAPRGNPLGMRIGYLPINLGEPENDYETTADDSITVPGLRIEKADRTGGDPQNPDTSAESRTIGSHREFQLEIYLPEGVSNNVVVADDLAAGDVSYVLARNAAHGYEIRCEYDDTILSIDGNTTLDETCESFRGALPQDGDTGSIAWDIGDVATHTEDDIAADTFEPVIRIIYFARIDNIDGTVAGNNFSNTAELTYDDAPVGAPELTASAGPIAVAEPSLSVTKTASVDSAVSGETVDYTVEITNATGPNVSTAFDINIADFLTQQLRDQLRVESATINGVDAMPGTRVGDGAYVWGRENNDHSLDIAPGETLTLIYSTTVLSAFGSDIINNVHVDWTSLDHGGLPGQEDYLGDYERHGENCPATQPPNIYCNSATDTVTTTDSTTFSKTAESTAWSPADRARIGDTVQYTLHLNLQPGTTRNVQVTDQLPPGLELITVDSIDCDGSKGFTCTPIIEPQQGDTLLEWNLGDVVAESDSTPPLQIAYSARVLNDTFAFPAGAAEVQRDNTAQLSYDGGTQGPETAPIWVVQPNITDLLKFDTRFGAADRDHTVMDITNEVMEFQLQACNTGGAPAYDLVISDTLNSDPANPEFDESTLNNLQVQIGGQPAAYTPTISNGVLEVAFQEPVPHQPANGTANCFTINYEIGLHQDIGSGHTWYNRFHADNYSSLDIASPEIRQYPGAAPACGDPATLNCFELQTPVADPGSLSLQLFDRNNDSRAPVGEELRYVIQVPGSPIASSALDEVTVYSSLERLGEVVRLESVTVDGVDYPGVSESDDPLTIELGQIPPGETRQIEIVAWIDNHPDAQIESGGLTINNTAYYEYIENGEVQRPTPDQVATVTVVEPTLELNKTASTSGGPQPVAGDILTFSLELSELNTNTFGSDAHDLVVRELLELGLVFESGSVSYNGSPLPDPAVNGDGINTPQTLEWSGLPAMDIPAGESRTLAFNIEVLDIVLAGQILNGTTTVQWTSQPAAPEYVERDGSGMPDPAELNNYFIPATQLDPPFTAANNISLAKNHLGDTAPLNDGELRIGDIVEYELRLGVQKGTLPNVVVTDTLPNGVVFVETVSIEDNGTAYDLTQEPIAGATGTVTWDLGDLVNSAGDGDEFVITYRTRVQKDAHTLNALNIDLLNQGRFAFDTAAGRSELGPEEVTLQLLQPDLSVSVAANPDGTAPLAPGETITFTAIITNSGTAPAYDPEFRDVIPIGMRQDGVQTLSINGGAAPLLQPTFDADSGEATWDFGSGTSYEIPAGGTLEVVYQVSVDPDIAAGRQISNNAFVQFYYSFDDDAVPAGATVDMRQVYGPTGSDSVEFTTPDAEPLSIAVEPVTRSTASIGEPFVYRLTIPATGSLHDVVVRMDLTDSGQDSVDLAFVGAAQVSGNLAFNPQGSVDANGVLFVEDATNGIDIEAGDEAVVDITLMLRDTGNNNDGEIFTSRASYNYCYENDNPDSQNCVGMGEVSEYSPAIEVVEPTILTLTKTGPTTVQSGLPGNFSLNVHNIGTGPAWDITITDILPASPGGMCETAPDTFTAQILDAANNPVGAALSAGTDFTTAFDVDSCTLTVTTSGALAQIPANYHLVFSYNAYLDADTADGASLTNVAGVELWHSWDSTGPEVRQYFRPAPDINTAGDVPDHEDIWVTTAAVPEVAFTKTVENISQNVNPASTAYPADVLRYTLTLTNQSNLDVNGISVTDDLGRLNSLALIESGSLQIVGVPAGATDNSNPTGGTNAAGLIDVSNLNLTGAGTPGESVQIVYEVTLVPVIDSGTAQLNQAEMVLPGQLPANSDDPNIGVADPAAGEEDPTQVVIQSAPDLIVEKTSEDLTPDLAILMAGDTLRYTITVQNVGNENAINALLRDQIPSNTTYVAGSTQLNGAAVVDVSGSSPLAAGMPINVPGEEDGYLPADPTASGTQVAVITFDVTINDVNDGTIISNQGFVGGEGAGSGDFAEQPSDDPATPLADDPTIDIVGDLPLLRVQKTVDIFEDNLTPGIVDPGDVLRYTITVANMGGVDATNAVLTDQVPADTTYEAGSTQLNGILVPDNAGGITRLDTGLPISSADLTPPLPGNGEGVITSAQTATIIFDVRVNAGTVTGTVISNQGNVTTEELPLVLTDADGNASNGAQPTQVVVGDAQQLNIIKEVAVVGGGAALPGATLEYLVRVTNISGVPATLVQITDDLLSAGENVLTYIDGSAQLNGLPTGVVVNGSLITADYSTNYGDLQPGGEILLRFQAMLDQDLEIGFTVTNTAQVQWNDPPVYNEASVSIDVGGTPGIANLNGYLWHDVNFNEVPDTQEALLAGWTVELYFDDTFLDSVPADENGYFQFTGLVPNLGTNSNYELRYLAPNASETTASLGNASSDFTNGPQRISEIVVGYGANPQNLNLPLTPNGVVYNSVVRQPINGARLTLLRASSGMALPEDCFDDPKQQNQITLFGGYYKFDINFSRAECAANADYLIDVQAPGDDYVAGNSLIIPPQTHVDSAAFDVPACLGNTADLIPATPEHCEVQLSAQTPPIDADPRSPETHYYLKLNLDDNRIPGESQLFNNHIPLDPQLDGAVSITKTAALLNVTRSQLVPYTITFSNTLPVPLTQLQLVDFFPAGFKYVAGSARVDGEAIEPQVDGLQLLWPDLRVEPDQTRTVKLLLVVGSGVGEGKYVNRARMFNLLSGQAASGEASATVRVIPDPTFDCSDVIGKVYNDKNMNGYQDQGEGGVPGARVVTATGLNATTDPHGRFHITCAVVPNPDRGSNFILKLDDRSLPSGYRMTTENPRVVRATRGKAIKVNFGSSLHRVVRLDMAEAVFEPETTELRPQWTSRTELLLEKLQEAPSVLRLSYLAENENPDLVEKRLQAVKAQIARDWASEYGDYELTIETEVFWRRGAPPVKGGLN